MGETFEKRAGSGEDLRGEAAGLAWLAEAEPRGGVRAARVLSCTRSSLVERRVRTGPPSAEAARRAGAALARTHAAGAPWLGCPPPGWDGAAYVISGVPTPVVGRDEAPASWGAFFARWRIEPLARLLRDEGTLDAAQAAVLGRVCARLERGELDAPQPALVRRAAADSPDVACARLHGDLWAGNLLWDADPSNPAGATVVDPMAHGGHAETDLAMLQLFGCAHLGELLAGYEVASPLAEGWCGRVALHQLSPLLLHCALFGYGYVGETMRAARRYA